MREHICQGCGQRFAAYGERQFCGRACANAARGKEATRWATYSCERCGTEVTTKPRYVGKYRFCDACRRIGHGERLQAAALDQGRRSPPVTQTCEQCGRAFTILACHAPRKFCGQACNGASRVGKPSTAKPPEGIPSLGVGGWRADLDGYFRSRWEANYARYLRLRGRSYIYEPALFVIRLPDNSEIAYTPDFLVDGTYYVEIKGWERPDRRQAEVLAAAAAQLPLPLLVIRQDGYRALEREIGGRIPTWEFSGDPRPPAVSAGRTCPTCGNRIESIHRRTVYCSRQCSNVRYRKPKEQRSCILCETGFEVSPWEDKRRFCSKPCADRSRSELVRQRMLGHAVSEATRRKISKTKRRQRHA